MDLSAIKFQKISSSFSFLVSLKPVLLILYMPFRRRGHYKARKVVKLERYITCHAHAIQAHFLQGVVLHNAKKD